MSFLIDKSKYSQSVPTAPVLPKIQINFLFHRADALEYEVCLARSLLETTTTALSFENAQERLWALQIEVGRALYGANKMAAIRALSLASEQRDLFAVDAYINNSKKAELMIKVLRDEISTGPKTATRALILAQMHLPF